MRPRSLLVLLLALALPAFVGPADGEAVRTHVVVLEDTVGDVDAATTQLLGPLGRTATWRYAHALRGFAAPLTAVEAERLAASPLVASVEPDRVFTPAATVVPTGVARIGAGSPAARGIRIDADVAVLDTGLVAEHPDLRVHRRVDCTAPVPARSEGWLGALVRLGDDERLVCAPDAGDDRTGHGTAVAGVIGGKDDGAGILGVAPGVRLWGVKVLGDRDPREGTTSRVVAGLDYVAEHARRLEVVNLSFVARGRSDAIDAAVEGATARGLIVVAAAGNAAEPASRFTPANAPHAITVSAITDLDGRPGGLAQGECEGRDDRAATYSNYGRDVALAAPGSCIVSTGVDGRAVRYSGTSMAAPHVAGVATRHVAGERFPGGSSRWSRVRDRLVARAAPVGSPCGVTHARSAEPLLRLTVC